jgi:hypothetical protein
MVRFFEEKRVLALERRRAASRPAGGLRCQKPSKGIHASIVACRSKKWAKMEFWL